MEMHLIDRLNAEVERFYRHIPDIALDIYSTIWAMSQSGMVYWTFWRFLLLVVDLVRIIIRFLAYLFHFEPPTFNALRDNIRAYMDPVADAEHRQLSLQFSSLQLIVAQLRDEKMRLARQNQHLHLQIRSMDDKTCHIQRVLTQEKHTARQLLLGILACRYKPPAAPPPKERSQAPVIIWTKLGALGIPEENVDQDQLQVAERLSSQLLVELLGYRRSMKAANNALATMASQQKSLQDTLEHQGTVSQSLLVELLSRRKEARVISSENQIKTRLGFMLTQAHYQQQKTRELEHEHFIRDILVQLLLFRKQLSVRRPVERGLSSPSVSSVTIPTSYPSYELESLRLSEAQARAEKDSLANSLGNILRELDFLKPYRTAPETPPITELVLALVFAWKSRRRPKPEVFSPTAFHTKHNSSGNSNAGLKFLPPGVAADSVRARAFRLGLRANMSATTRPTNKSARSAPYPSPPIINRSMPYSATKTTEQHATADAPNPHPTLVTTIVFPKWPWVHQSTSHSPSQNDAFSFPLSDPFKQSPTLYPGSRPPPNGVPPMYRDNVLPLPVGVHPMFKGSTSASATLHRDLVHPPAMGAPSRHSTMVPPPMPYAHPHLPREFYYTKYN